MIDYSSLLNKTVKDIKPSGIRKFFDIAATMDNVISLGVGEPDFQTPWPIRKAGIESLEKGKTKYTSNWGIDRLRSEISGYLEIVFSLCFYYHGYAARKSCHRLVTDIARLGYYNLVP